MQKMRGARLCRKPGFNDSSLLCYPLSSVFIALFSTTCPWIMALPMIFPYSLFCKDSQSVMGYSCSNYSYRIHLRPAVGAVSRRSPVRKAGDEGGQSSRKSTVYGHHRRGLCNRCADVPHDEFCSSDFVLCMGRLWLRFRFFWCSGST